MVEGRARREGKKRKRGIYVAPKISSETMRSVTPRATPRQTVVLPRFLFPLSVLASGDSSPFRLVPSFLLPLLLAFFSRATFFSFSPVPETLSIRLLYELLLISKLFYKICVDKDARNIPRKLHSLLKRFMLEKINSGYYI